MTFHIDDLFKKKVPQEMHRGVTSEEKEAVTGPARKPQGHCSISSKPGSQLPLAVPRFAEACGNLLR